MNTPPEIIRQRSADIVDAVAQDKVGGWRWIKQLVATTIKEYRGRFLHELIQNGFDAHPEDACDGRIAVHFHEDEGAHGVLYVANGGRPLSESNFRGMASLGDSDKTLGVGIGNKGVGFKSVFQICDAPEVFSAASTADIGFSGFTFRFGTRADFDALTFDDEATAQKVERELSLSLLTVPLSSVPARVSAFRADGYVTVLRLPAASARAAGEIRDRIDHLVTSRSPVMLFLDRLETLSIRVSEDADPILLTRRQEHDGALARIILNDSERFLLFRRLVPHSELRTALQEAVDDGSLDEHWLSWQADAHVSVAVGDGWMIPDPAPFTFLPMSDTTQSPLGGHINAPFITDFARLGLSADQPVNQLLFQRIADLCVDAAASLIAMDGDPNAVVDLLAWRSSDAHWLHDSPVLKGNELEAVIQLPALGRTEWPPLVDLWIWPDPHSSVITAEQAISAAGALLINTGRVDDDRRERLGRITSSLNPPVEILAGWVEAIAEKLCREQADLTMWRAFYDDLPALFTSAKALGGRRIILTQDQSMAEADQPSISTPSARTHSGPRRQRTVFFAPKAANPENPETEDDDIDSDGDITPPKSLAARLVFLHPELEWHDGPQQTPGRHFLQTNELARPFRTASLLSHLAHVMADRPSDTIKRDALHFAYSLFANNPTKHSKNLAAVALSVKSTSGDWLPAADAHFAKGWPVDGADELSRLAAGAPDPNSELAQMSKRLIAEPSVLGIMTADLARWTNFLTALGVTATLPINKITERRSRFGRSLTAKHIASNEVSGPIPAGIVHQWREGITSTGNLHHPETAFATKDPVYWFAGQHEIAGLPNRLRRDYARLAFLTIPTLTSTHLKSTWRRHRPGGTNTHIETPLMAFLTSAQWVPVATPGASGRVFQQPRDSWHIGTEDHMAATYSPLIDAQLRKLMNRETPTSQQRWDQLGFLNWSADSHANFLIGHLTELFRTGDIPDTAGEHFRSTLATAWAVIGKPHAKFAQPLDDVAVVERSGLLTLLERSTDAPNGVDTDAAADTLYVSSRTDESASTRLVRELGWPVVVVDSSDQTQLNKVARALSTWWPRNVTVTSGWELQVRADGNLWQASNDAPLLTAEIPWLPLLLACVMRFPRGSGMRIGRQLDRMLESLGRIRLVQARQLAIVSATHDEVIPARLHGVLPMAGEIPTVLTEGHDGALTWVQLEYLTHGVLELLNQERFTAEVSLSIRDLATGQGQTVSRPLNEEIAETLGVTNAQVTEVESAVFGAINGVVARLELIAPCAWGQTGLDVFTDLSSTARSRDDVLDALVVLCGEEPRAQEILAAASSAPTADALRRHLSISLVDYNAALSRYFPTQSLIDNGAEHDQELGFYVQRRRLELLDRARAARLPTFLAGKIQDDWVSIRNLNFLQCDPTWSTTLDELDDAVIEDRIEELMRSVLGPEPVHETLTEWSKIQESNGKALRDRLVQTRRTMQAWCEREQKIMGQMWMSDSFDEALRQRLDLAGALDFTPLSDADLAEWLIRIDAWPDGMLASTDPAKHGLTTQELYAQATADADERARRARAAKQVDYQGHAIDLDSSMSALVSGVSAFLRSSPASIASAYRKSTMRVIDPHHAPIRTVARTGGNGRSVMPTLTTEQKNAVGLAGEIIAFHWLQLRDPSSVVDESCWKSGNARFVYEGLLGDDGLGFDFEVPRSGGSIMYEVKATTGDAGMIELGETEVRCAQQHARSERWRLLIVEHTLSTEPLIHMLPNPFHRDSRSLFSFVGNSVRLRFALAD